MKAINSMVEGQGEFVQAFRENVICIIGSYSTQNEPTEYDTQIEQIQQKMMDGYMKKTSYLKQEFDDDLVRRLIQTIRVINESKIETQFKSGIVMAQRIDFED